MKRVHVLELEDLSGFPSWLRACMTNVLAALAAAIGVVPVLGALVSRALEENGLDAVVDLGSGAGGVMPSVMENVREASATNATLTLTDLYPNDDAVARFEADPNVTYARESVDATDLANAPAGLKTMINCFHHMRPAQARAILASAQASGQPLLIYEMGENKLPFVVWVLLLPLTLPIVYLSCLVLTLRVRPLTFRQLFFTYVIPLVPLCYAWDGQASMPRLYTFEDMDELLEGLPTDGYRWEKGVAKTDKGRALGTYLLGRPT